MSARGVKAFLGHWIQTCPLVEQATFEALKGAPATGGVQQEAGSLFVSPIASSDQAWPWAPRNGCAGSTAGLAWSPVWMCLAA